jgi:hypothetical protein
MKIQTNKYKVQLPKIYSLAMKTNFLSKIRNKVFYDNNIWNLEILSLDWNKHLELSKENKLYLKEYDLVEEDHITIGEICSTTKMLSKDLDEFIDTHPLSDKGFIPIGDIIDPYSSLLLLGITDKNEDEIWMNISQSEGLFKIADNIFSFLNLLEYEWDENALPDLQIPKNQIQDKIVKNFGEDFWRLK